MLGRELTFQAKGQNPGEEGGLEHLGTVVGGMWEGRPRF